MNRLINEYGAFNTPLGCKAVDMILRFEAEVIAFIKEHDLTPEEIRVLSGVTNADVACAEMVLTLATKMKKALS